MQPLLCFVFTLLPPFFVCLGRPRRLIYLTLTLTFSSISRLSIFFPLLIILTFTTGLTESSVIVSRDQRRGFLPNMDHDDESWKLLDGGGTNGSVTMQSSLADVVLEAEVGKIFQHQLSWKFISSQKRHDVKGFHQVSFAFSVELMCSFFAAAEN